MKKRGFTLVEILAVIAVIAILAIVILPNVVGTFNNAKERSFLSEVKTIHKTAKQTWAADSIETPGEIVYTRCQTCSGKTLGLSGRTELDYYVKLSKKGKVIRLYVTDGTYQYNYDGELELDDIKGVKLVSSIPAHERFLIENDDINETANLSSDAFYYNTSSGQYYATLNDAVNAAVSNQTIKVMKDKNEDTPVVIPNSLNDLKIDLNKYTVSFDEYKTGDAITNNGKIEIFSSSTNGGTLRGWDGILNNGEIIVKENATIYTENTPITNTGTLTLSGGTLHGREGCGIINSGTFNMSSGVLSGYPTALVNSSSATITGGEVNGSKGVENKTSGVLTINNIKISSSDYGVYNYGTFTTSGCQIVAKSYYSSYGIINYGTSTINNITMNITSTGNGNRSYGIYNYQGQTTLNGGNINVKIENDAYESIGVYDKATFIMNSGSILVQTYKTADIGSTGIYANGNTTILGGSITSAETGIEVLDGYTLTLGNNNGTVDLTSPVIHANGMNGTGIQVKTNGIFNFYDGVVKSSRGNNYSIRGTVTNTPSGWTVHKELNSGIESAYLVVE